MTDTSVTAPGLTEAEARARAAAGQANRVDHTPSRTYAHILRANLFTRFNAILGGLLAVIIVIGPFQDALFGVVLVTNAIVGVAQEVRAKRALDRLALLNEPRPRVRREGKVRAVADEEVVLGDLLEVGPGEQVVVDARVVAAVGLEVDESLLTGEAAPVSKEPGDEVLSGSFVVAGSGTLEATRVGNDAYAARLAAEARRFNLVRSELQAGIDRILRLVTWLLIPASILLVSSQLASHSSIVDAVRGSVAGIGSMVPEGLVLLTTIAFAAGALRLSRRNVLVQELAALEGLARVDVVCVDKTGTLTTAELEPAGTEALPGAPGTEDEAQKALGALAAADANPNATLRTIEAAFPPPDGWVARGAVPFASSRKWSAADFGEHGTWVLGAPDVLLPAEHPARQRTDTLAAEGVRVVVLARAPSLDALAPEGLPPGGLPPGAPVEPVLLVALREHVRDDAPATLRYFAEQGVTVKVVSGDHPATVAAVARRAGLTVVGMPTDARSLPRDDPHALAEILEQNNVFGRVVPDQKREIVHALQQRGHVVGMTGDGVNDVLALKDADLGVAMGSGTAAARSVARLVLLDDAFSSLPAVVAEGRRVIANVERVANLFVTKTVYAFVLAVAVGVARLPFPFLPRQLTIVSSLTIGVPAFFLALGPAGRRARPGFVGRVLGFAVPAGTVAAATTFAAYAIARAAPGTTSGEARTAATFALFSVGMAVLFILAWPPSPPRIALLIAMAGTFGLINSLPWTRTFFALSIPSPVVAFATIGVSALGCAGLMAGWAIAALVRRRYQLKERVYPQHRTTIKSS